MNFIDRTKTAFYVLTANKLRSIFMLIGIVVGVASVIIVVALGTVAQKKILKELETFGINSIWISRNWEDRNKAKENFFLSNNELSNASVLSCRKRFKELLYVTPCLFSFANVSCKEESQRMGVIGTTQDFFYTNNETMQDGRFLTKYDVSMQRKVCVISIKLKEEIFDKDKALGENLEINREKFKIIGILKEKETPFLDAIRSVRKDNQKGIYVPISIIQTWYNTKNVSYIQAMVMDHKNLISIETKLKKYFTEMYNNNIEFDIKSMREYIDISNKIIGILKIIFIVVASVSLFIGGLSITNIMLISVKERTKEIGLRKAVGAKEIDIILQFLIEAIIISLTGGIIGILAGSFLIGGLMYITKLTNIFSFMSICLAFLFSCFVGIVAGIYPATTAAKLDPIIALRYE